MSSISHHNNVLSSLPAEDYRRISRELRLAPLKTGQSLQRSGEPLQDVYFPDRCLCSLVIRTADGCTAEVAVVGAEGFVGVESAFGMSNAFTDVIVHAAGDAVCHVLSMSSFRREFDEHGAFHAAVMQYAHAFVEGLMQSVVCNGLHSADARCCRWLLHAHDRLAADTLAVTHDLLAAMLGVRRPTVTLIIADLSRRRIVSTSRGAISITDRAALEARACECYRAATRRLDHLVPAASATTCRAVESSNERASALA